MEGDQCQSFGSALFFTVCPGETGELTNPHLSGSNSPIGRAPRGFRCFARTFVAFEFAARIRNNSLIPARFLPIIWRCYVFNHGLSESAGYFHFGPVALRLFFSNETFRTRTRPYCPGDPGDQAELLSGGLDQKLSGR